MKEKIIKDELIKFAKWCSENDIDFSGQAEHTVNHYYYEDVINVYLNENRL